MQSSSIKKSYCLCIFLLLFTTIGNTQTDSLASKSFEELENLYLITVFTAPEKARHYANALYLATLKGNNQQRIAKALYRKGYTYWKTGNSSKGLEFTEASLEMALKIQDSVLVLQNYAQKGNIYLDAGTYKKAIEEYLKAKQVAKQHDNFRSLLALSYNIGLVKKQIEDYPGALQDFRQNLYEIKKANSSVYDQLEIENCLAIADTYLRIEHPDSALVYTSRGLQKAPKNTYKELHLDLLLNKVIILFQQKKYQESIELALSLEQITKEINHDQKFVTSYLYLGKNYMALNDVDNAILYFEKIKALINAEKFSFPELEEVYYHLAKMYFHKGNTQKADVNFKLFEAFTKANDIANRKTYHTIKDYDIATLKKEISDLNKQSQQQEKTVYYLYIIASVFLSCIIAFLIFYKRKQRLNKQRFDALLTHIKKIETPKKTGSPTKQKTELAINDEGVVQILKDLEKFEQKQQFLHVNCNLSYTAKKLKTNTTYLSHVINTYKGKSFTAYLTELRINAALIGLKNNEKLRLYSMEAIAKEFGFKRRETFSKVFKNMTGMHPTNYIKELQKEQEESRDNS